MSEKCPLIDFTWLSDYDSTKICQEQCGALWENAVSNQAGDIDDFTCSIDNDCPHIESEFLDDSLQRDGIESGRIYSVNSQCTGCGGELDSFSYKFDCPYN